MTKYYNTKTGERGEVVKIEGSDFLRVDGGHSYISLEKMDSSWVEGEDKVLELRQIIRDMDNGVERGFAIYIDRGDGAQMIVNNMNQLALVETILSHLTDIIREDGRLGLFATMVLEGLLDDDE